MAESRNYFRKELYPRILNEFQICVTNKNLFQLETFEKSFPKGSNLLKITC